MNRLCPQIHPIKGRPGNDPHKTIVSSPGRIIRIGSCIRHSDPDRLTDPSHPMRSFCGYAHRKVGMAGLPSYPYFDDMADGYSSWGESCQA